MKLAKISLVPLAIAMCLSATGFAQSAKKGLVIGFSNSYNGNTYRQTMESLFKKLADQMVADGTLKSYKVLESNNNVATQVSQIESLILSGVNAIIVDPGSAAGLNGAIEKATAAGIPVVIVNDGPVTTDKCYQVNEDTSSMASNAAAYMVMARAFVTVSKESQNMLSQMQTSTMKTYSIPTSYILSNIAPTLHLKHAMLFTVLIVGTIIISTKASSCSIILYL